MTPIEIYQNDLSRSGFQYDPAQEQAVNALEAVYQGLVERVNSRAGAHAAVADLPNQHSLILRINKIISMLASKQVEPLKPVKGLYMWGGVGRGKTYLMDLFFESLPFERKLRLHFHRFMKRVHAELRSLQGEKNPLQIVADRIAGQAVVICFDEFFVSDITDAMILGGLFEALFDRGVSLVSTSNIPPDDLYKDGLQRGRFLPAIEAVKLNTKVLELDGGVDYRLRALERAEIYHWPIDEQSEQGLESYFTQLVPGHVSVEASIEIEGRDIDVRQSGDDVLWAYFDQLCDGPRSQHDYIEIARMYHAVLLSHVPQLQAKDDDRARRFIYLVDEFYDRNVKLIISAEVSIEQLYVGDHLQFEFQRTQSRLLEMQSHEYLEKGHQPE